MTHTAQHAQTRVAFIGVGAMGLPMAQRIAKANYAVTAVDPSPQCRLAAADAGIEAVASVSSLRPARIAIIVVANSEQLADCVTGERGLFSIMDEGSVCVVMSTVGPTVLEKVSAWGAAAGVDVIDAPVTGGVARAASGELTIFAAGPVHPLNQMMPVLEAMGSVHHCGRDAGRAQSYKMVNQLLASVHLVAAAEALAFAEHLNLDTADVLSAVSSGAGASFMLGDRGPRMVADDGADALTALDIFVKDSSLVSEVADAVQFRAPLLAATAEAFRLASDRGLGRCDDSRVKDVYR